MAAYRYLRQRGITLNAGTPFCAAATINFRATVGGANLTGTAIADSAFAGLPATNAFDGNINTLWACNGTGPGFSWIGLDLGLGITSALGEFTWTSRNDGSWNQSPSYVKAEGSNDAVNWELIFETAMTFTGAGQTNTIAVPATPPDLRPAQAPRLSLLTVESTVQIPQTPRLAVVGGADARIAEAVRLALIGQVVSARMAELNRLSLAGGNSAWINQAARLTLRSSALGAVEDEEMLSVLW